MITKLFFRVSNNYQIFFYKKKFSILYNNRYITYILMKNFILMKIFEFIDE